MINVSVFDDMTLCTDQEVERMIPLVPEPRRSDALKFKHTCGRFACLKAYLEDKPYVCVSSSNIGLVFSFYRSNSVGCGSSWNVWR